MVRKADKEGHMQKTTLPVGVTTALVMAWVLIACNDGPTRPSVVIPRPASPPGGVTLVSVEITGPATVPPGGTEQFTAIARYSDGTAPEVTTEAIWQSADVSVLSVSPTGVVTGHSRGEASLSVVFRGRSSVKSGVMVLPPNTYRVSGVVRDAGLPVPDARVEVASGPDQGLSRPASPLRLPALRCCWRCRVTRDQGGVTGTTRSGCG